MGDDPNFQAPALPAPTAAAPPVRENTSPTFPPRAPDGASPMQGIETASTADNVGQALV
jgi:hypothetical protein